jgi:hydroxyacylglutathione hydrolase
VHRIQLDNDVFEGENAVYLLGHEDAGPTTLIDTGIDTSHTEATLSRELAAVDVAVGDLDQVLLTHYHGDHAGLAGMIEAESDATVWIHEADAEMVADPDAGEAYRDRLHTRMEEWGMPDEARSALLGFLEWSDGERTTGVPVREFADGDRIPVGTREFEVVHLPGHTAGQSGFLDVDTGSEADGDETVDLYAGDAVLPVYTPNVGGADLRVSDALAKYADSLVRVVETSPDRLLPGHRDPIDEPATRAREILAHHRERTERVVGVLRAVGPATPWEVSARLFGDLEAIHILHGPGEAVAHLDHLVSHGLVERRGRRYALASAEVDPAGILPDPP